MRVRWILSGLAAIAVLALGSYLLSSEGFKGRPVVIGVLNHGAIAEQSLEGFKLGLAELGYAEGRQVTYLYKGPLQGKALEEEARAMAARKPDLLLALSTPAAKAGREAARDLGIPLVFAPASDPVGAGLANTLANPGRNASGVTFGVQEPVRLQWLRSMVPGIRVVLVPYNPDDLSPRLSVERIVPVAREMGLRLDLRHVRSVSELDALLADLPQDADALFIPTDALIASNLSRILPAAMARRLPVSAVERSSVKEGALMSYGFDLRALGRQAARIAAQILVGTPAGDLPVETAEFGLSINVESARRLGLVIPDNILRQGEIFRSMEGGNAR